MKYPMRDQDRGLENRKEVDEILSKGNYVVTLSCFRAYREKEKIDNSMKGGCLLWEKLQDAV